MAKPSKHEKRAKKLKKRMMRDFQEALELSVANGAINRESISPLLQAVAETLTRHEREYGVSDDLRAAGRFLEHLHSAHEKRIADGQLSMELHDLQTLARISKMAKKGKSAEQIAGKMRKEGERITAEGITRILAGKQ